MLFLKKCKKKPLLGYKRYEGDKIILFVEGFDFKEYKCSEMAAEYKYKQENGILRRNIKWLHSLI